MPLCVCVSEEWSVVDSWLAGPGQDAVRLALLAGPAGESPPQAGYSAAAFWLLCVAPRLFS